MMLENHVFMQQAHRRKEVFNGYLASLGEIHSLLKLVGNARTQIKR